jgi:hypothetical protein
MNYRKWPSLFFLSRSCPPKNGFSLVVIEILNAAQLLSVGQMQTCLIEGQLSGLLVAHAAFAVSQLPEDSPPVGTTTVVGAAGVGVVVAPVRPVESATRSVPDA